MKKKIAAIDAGTTKVCTVTGILDSSSGLRILGVGIAPSQGIQKSLVVNVNQAKESIRQSIRKAEVMAGYKIDSAYVGVTGRHISSANNKATIAITRSDQMVRHEDLSRVLHVALSGRSMEDRKMLHVIPRAYTLDGQVVESPVGMHGYELSVEAHVVTGAASSVRNLSQCVNGLGIQVEDLILEPLAASEAVLTEAEKEIGVLLADIGGGVTNVAIVKSGSIYHTSVIPVAGQQITQDIASGLGISVESAEEIKIKYGSLVPLEDKEADEDVDAGGRLFSYRSLCEIIGARAEELVRLIKLELPGTGYPRLIPAGIVLTGGSANLPGLVELTASITGLPVRIGLPPTLNGVANALLNDPAYATSAGLILWKMKNDSTPDRAWTISRPTGFKGFFSRSK